MHVRCKGQCVFPEVWWEFGFEFEAACCLCKDSNSALGESVLGGCAGSDEDVPSPIGCEEELEFVCSEFHRIVGDQVRYGC